MNDNFYIFKTGIGQDSHRFDKTTSKPCILGGVIFPNTNSLIADSDGDVILHSICNAISSISSIPILGGVAIELCKKKITDSKIYLEKAFLTLNKNQQIIHLAISIEALKPRLQDKINIIKKNIASILKMETSQIGITVTSGDFLTSFGKGEGIQCITIITVQEKKI